MEIELGWRRWAAWAPGLESSAAWQSWAQSPHPPFGEALAPATEVPPMLRRRLDPLGRAVLQVAASAMQDTQPEIVVFVSRRGDSQRSLALLEALLSGESLSPTAFGLSVHNAIVAQYMMWRGNRAAYTALSAGREGVEHALLEVAAQLAGRPDASALLLVCESAVPERYAAFRDEPDALYAWALQLAAVAPDLPRIGLRLDGATGESAECGEGWPTLPAGLAPLAGLLGGHAGWQREVDGRRWCWRCHG